MKKEHALPTPGSEAYGQEIKRGFVLISTYRTLLGEAETAPMYYAGGYDMDGNLSDIEENLAPWEAVEKAAHAIAESQAALKIMQAHQLTVEQVSPDGGVVIRNREGEVVRSREIPVFIRSTDREKKP